MQRSSHDASSEDAARWKILKPRQLNVMVRAPAADPHHDRNTIHFEAIDAFGNTSQGETQVTITAGGKKKGRR